MSCAAGEGPDVRLNTQVDDCLVGSRLAVDNRVFAPVKLLGRPDHYHYPFAGRYRQPTRGNNPHAPIADVQACNRMLHSVSHQCPQQATGISVGPALVNAAWRAFQRLVYMRTNQFPYRTIAR